jgi:uncharacterized damage-inducible protein DinB
MTPDAMLAHWQGHRRLTRRVVDLFPDDRLFTFAIGGMRPFGAMVMEMIAMTVPTVRGVLTDEWTPFTEQQTRPKQAVLELWDETTEELDHLWRAIPAARFSDTVTAFGLYTDAAHKIIKYAIDNEIHHRGQGYVYLRALGIEPPPFHVRS